MWWGTILIGAGEGLSQSHHPSLANRVGTGIRRPSAGVQGGLWTDLAQLLAARSAGVQESFADLVHVAFRAGAGDARLIRPIGPQAVRQAPTVVSMINRIGIAALWLLGLACVFAAINKNDPYLISLRGAGNIALAVASVVISAVLVARGSGRRRGIAGKLLVLLWGLAPLSMLGAHITFEVRKRDVLHTDAAQA